MEVDLRYPLVLRHVPRGFHSERHMACSRATTVEIAELSGIDAPVVVHWVPEAKGVGEARRFRLVGERVMGMVNGGRARSCRFDDAFPCYPLALEAKAAITKAVLEKGRANMVPADGFIDPAKWVDITDKMPPLFNPADERYWDERFRDLVSVLVAVEGEVWRPSPDPVICVHRNAFGWHTSVVTEQDIGQDLMRFHYTVDRFEEAREACRRLSNGKPVASSRLEHDPAWVPGVETDIADISSVVARVVAILNAETSARARASGSAYGTVARTKPKVDWSLLPADLFGAYAALRRYDESVSPHDERSVSAAVEALETLVGLSGSRGLSWLLPQAVSVQAHVDKWHARPIAFEVKADVRPARTHGR